MDHQKSCNIHEQNISSDLNLQNKRKRNKINKKRLEEKNAIYNPKRSKRKNLTDLEIMKMDSALNKKARIFNQFILYPFRKYLSYLINPEVKESMNYLKKFFKTKMFEHNELYKKLIIEKKCTYFDIFLHFLPKYFENNKFNIEEMEILKVVLGKIFNVKEITEINEVCNFSQSTTVGTENTNLNNQNKISNSDYENQKETVHFIPCDQGLQASVHTENITKESLNEYYDPIIGTLMKNFFKFFDSLIKKYYVYEDIFQSRQFKKIVYCTDKENITKLMNMTLEKMINIYTDLACEKILARIKENQLINFFSLIQKPLKYIFINFTNSKYFKKYTNQSKKNKIKEYENGGSDLKCLSSKFLHYLHASNNLSLNELRNNENFLGLDEKKPDAINTKNQKNEIQNI